MINGNVGYKFFEVTDIDKLWGHLEREFTLPGEEKRVEYQTAKGTFTVEVSISDRRTDQVTLIYQTTQFVYHNPDCGHDHTGGNIYTAPGIGQFCKSVMKVTYKDNFDASTKGRVEKFMTDWNKARSPGATWLTPGDYPGVSGFLMKKENGEIGSSAPFVLPKNSGN